MTDRAMAPVVSGVVAAVAVFFMLLLLGKGTGASLAYAVLVGVVAAGVTWMQLRNRS